MLSEIILFLPVLVAIWFILTECKKPSGYPPGPRWIPILGNLPILQNLSKKLGGLHLAIFELSKAYRSDVIGFKLGQERLICVNSYPKVKLVLTSEEYEGRPDNFFMRLRCLGTRKGITGTDGELWNEQRSFVVSHLRAVGFGKTEMDEMIHQELREIILEIEQNLNDVDLSHVLTPSVLNILWIMTSGASLRGDQHIQQLLNLFSQRSKAFDMSGGALNYYPWLRFIMPDKIGYTLAKKFNGSIKKIMQDSVNEHKSTWEEEKNDDLMYAFFTEMNKRKGQPNNFTDDQLILICVDLFFGGSTTTSNTMGFLFQAMIRYPDVQQKVQQCIDKAFYESETISYKERQRAPYVEAVILESQRCYPVGPIAGPRRVLRETNLDGYTIPKDATVLINLHSVHYDKEYWKDPEIFRPERFLDKDGNLTGQDRVLTYALGKRRCPGDALARSVIFTFFVEIMRRYTLKSAASEKNSPPKPLPGITMSPAPHRVQFVPR